jgi:creatinine amidohydrolase
MTMEDLAALLDGGAPLAALVPVGTVEPHGPHLALGTDNVISRASVVRAAELLAARGVQALVTPGVPFGVTRCGAGFPGAIDVGEEALLRWLRAVIDGLLDTGFMHVCLVNNHLEPAHDQTVRRAVEGRAPGSASVASPLTRRWARTLSDEFKSGACHAGEYETSIVMAVRPEWVDENGRVGLPEVPVSLSEKLADGVTDFRAMGLERAYAGSPATANAEHGTEMVERLAEMVAAVVCEALDVDTA